MGKSTSEISQELEETRADAADKIERIEQQVTESAEMVKQNLDWRYQVDSHPLAAVGAAFVGGLLLGGMSGGGDDHDRSRHSAYDANGNRIDYSREDRHDSGLSGALRQATHDSGVEAAVSSAAAMAMAAAGKRVKEAIGELYPGLVDQYETSRSENGKTARYDDPERSMHPAGQPTHRAV